MVATIDPYRLVDGTIEDVKQSFSIGDAWKKAKEMGLREVVLYRSDQSIDGDPEIVIQSRWWSPDDAEKFFSEFDNDIEQGENFKLERVDTRRILKS